ncbi:MAG: glycosyltransferase family A protein [Planctomycetota bacterium]
MPDTEANSPTLSIITPVYNAAEFLPRTLASFDAVAPEHRQRVQLLLIDDGSSDDSPAFLKGFRDERSADFAGIDVIHKDNGGSASARNVGLDAARGDWLLFLDADDELIADPIPRLHAAGDASALGVAIELAPPAGRPKRYDAVSVLPGRHLDRLTANNPNYVCGLIPRRKRVEQRFNERIRTLEDWAFWLNNPAIFDRMTIENDAPVVRVNVHGGNKSSNIARRGRVRAQVAKEAMERFYHDLTRMQRNNLKTQISIGEAMEGNRQLGSLLRWPVDPLLYIKLLMFQAFGSRALYLDMYARARLATYGSAGPAA